MPMREMSDEEGEAIVREKDEFIERYLAERDLPDTEENEDVAWHAWLDTRRAS